MSDMFWEWYSSLMSMRKKVIDIYLWRCSCGYTWKFSKLQLLKMFLKDEYIHTCPQCQRQSRYRMITHVIRDTPTDEMIEHNKMLEW